MSDFGRIRIVLNDLAATAKKLDFQRGVQPKAIFDERLFHCQSRLLAPCVQEAIETFNTILSKRGKEEAEQIETPDSKLGNTEDNRNVMSPRQAEYLTQQLLDQIGAISREISTSLRSKNEPTRQQTLRALQQKLIQHQEWESRLEYLVLEKQTIAAIAHIKDKESATEALDTAKRRLQRCQQSKIEIEQQIYKLKESK